MCGFAETSSIDVAVRQQQQLCIFYRKHLTIIVVVVVWYHFTGNSDGSMMSFKKQHWHY